MVKTPGWLTSIGVVFSAAALIVGAAWAEKGTVANEEIDLAHPVMVEAEPEMAIPINVEDLQDARDDVIC